MRDFDWSDYEADGARAAEEAGAFQYDGEWYLDEAEWFAAQTPEVQAEYREYEASIMAQGEQYATPDYDTRHMEGL